MLRNASMTIGLGRNSRADGRALLMIPANVILMMDKPQIATRRLPPTLAAPFSYDAHTPRRSLLSALFFCLAHIAY